MKQFLKEPKMLKEAKAQSKSHNIWIEILIFLLVLLIVMIAESVIGVIVGTPIMMSNRQISEYIRDVAITVSQGGSINMAEYVSGIMSMLPDSFIIATLFSTAVMIAGAIIYCRFIERRKPSTMGYRKKGLIPEYLVGLVLGTLLFGLAVLICCFTGAAQFNGISPQFSIAIIVFYFLGYIVQGMSEEVMFRGYFMVSVSRRYPIAIAVAVSSIAFSLAHLANTGITLLALVNITLCGVLFGLYIIKRGNIWGAAAMHTAWNFAEGNLFGTSVSGMTVKNSIFSISMSDKLSIINGGKFGPEGGLAVTVIMVTAIVALLFMNSNKNEI